MGALVVDLITAANAQGLLRSSDVFNTNVNARTMVHGLARMYVDRQLAEWGIEDSAAEMAMAAAVRHFVRTLAVDADRHGFEA